VDDKYGYIRTDELSDAGEGYILSRGLPVEIEVGLSDIAYPGGKVLKIC
jgi:hypothetical protein